LHPTYALDKQGLGPPRPRAAAPKELGNFPRSDTNPHAVNVNRYAPFDDKTFDVDKETAKEALPVHVEKMAPAATGDLIGEA
jgi:hypothetical protein